MRVKATVLRSSSWYCMIGSACANEIMLLDIFVVRPWLVIPSKVPIMTGTTKSSKKNCRNKRNSGEPIQQGQVVNWLFTPPRIMVYALYSSTETAYSRPRHVYSKLFKNRRRCYKTFPRKVAINYKTIL